VSHDFEHQYRETVALVLRHNLPTILCTIYNGGFAEQEYKESVRIALLLFNDVILRVATEHRLPLIDLRTVCTEEEDYANPIEPSTIGAAKIAQRILSAVIACHRHTAYTFVVP